MDASALNEKKWIIFTAVLAVLSFGLSGILKLIACLLIVLSGSLAVLFTVTEATNVNKDKRQKWPLSRLKRTKKSESIANPNPILTGFPEIDMEMAEMLDFILRDYVHSWNSLLNHCNDFPNEIRRSLIFTVSGLSAKIRQVDWIPFLTTRFVFDLSNHVKLYKKAREMVRNGSSPDIESGFFDSELNLNNEASSSSSSSALICRDKISTTHEDEIRYLQDISDLILFELLPKEDFSAQTLRTLTRELLVNVVLKPVLDLISEPDFINQQIVYFLSNVVNKPEVLSAVIRSSESIEELSELSDCVEKELTSVRSKDSVEGLKLQLDALLVLKKTLDSRLTRLKSGSVSETDAMLQDQVDWNQMVSPKLKLFVLPIEVILKNSVALSYFIDFMSAIDSQAYVFFYLNIEGWKVSTEMQLQTLPEDTPEEMRLENLREAAQTLYEEYLSEKANPRLKIDDSLIKRLLLKIRTEPVNPEWFQEAQTSICHKLESEEAYLKSFRNSMGYAKLLAELDLLQHPGSMKSDNQDNPDSESIYDNLSLNSYEGEDEIDDDLNSTLKSSENEFKGHRRVDSDQSSVYSSNKRHKRNSSHDFSTSSAGPDLTADVVDVERAEGKSYAVYKILVCERNEIGRLESHSILRRYSDFYALQDRVSSRYVTLSRLPFPSKKTFGNLDRDLLFKRKKMLHDYLQELIKAENLEAHPGLYDLVRKFLDQSSYEKERAEASSVAVRAVGSMRNSVKTVSSAVTSVPTQMFSAIDHVLTKGLQPKPIDNAFIAASASSADILEDNNNIPLRIALLFMDEVFDLRERNQWLRRQIVFVVRQFLKAMFGDIVNRRIIEKFAHLTSPSTLGSYLKALKDSLWPDGYPAAQQPDRDESTKMRTRVAAKMALFSSLSDELRRIIGSETTRTGLLMIFDLLQHQVLNRRLCIVLLEAILDAVFQDKDFPAIFAKLHSKSNRLRNDLKTSQRKAEDLMRNQSRTAL